MVDDYLNQMGKISVDMKWGIISIWSRTLWIENSCSEYWTLFWSSLIFLLFAIATKKAPSIIFMLCSEQI